MLLIALVGVGLVLAMCSGVVILYRSALPPDQGVLRLREALESGQIKLDDPSVEWRDSRSFPMVVFNVEATETDPSVWVHMFYQRGESITLYSLDERLVAAQYARGMVDASFVKFYFIDQERFQSVTRILQSAQDPVRRP